MKIRKRPRRRRRRRLPLYYIPRHTLYAPELTASPFMPLAPMTYYRPIRYLSTSSFFRSIPRPSSPSLFTCSNRSRAVIERAVFLSTSSKPFMDCLSSSLETSKERENFWSLSPSRALYWPRAHLSSAVSTVKKCPLNLQFFSPPRSLFARENNATAAVDGFRGYIFPYENSSGRADDATTLVIFIKIRRRQRERR